MSTFTVAQHDELAELLPDFAIGALSDGDLQLVETHLASCPQCRTEFEDLLHIISIIAPAPPPSLETRRVIFERAGHPLGERMSAGAPRPLVTVPRAPSAVPVKVMRMPARLAWIVISAAAIALLALGGWNLWLQRELGDQEALIALIAEPGNAYPLTDSEIPTEASAIFYVDPERDQALLTAQDLPSLTSDQRYQVWLFTEDGQRVSGGTFVPESDGTVALAVDPADPLSTYWAVGVSTEPAGGSDAPTSPLLLGGWIQ